LWHHFVPPADSHETWNKNIVLPKSQRDNDFGIFAARQCRKSVRWATSLVIHLGKPWYIKRGLLLPSHFATWLSMCLSNDHVRLNIHKYFITITLSLFQLHHLHFSQYVASNIKWGRRIWSVLYSFPTETNSK